MVFSAKNRVPPVDVLKFDYEYCNISCYTQGARNDLGEPSRTLMERATNVKCSIDPLTRAPGYVTQSGLRDVLRQGVIERSIYIMTLSSSQAIEPGDIVTDCNDITYDVLQVLNWYSHKEAFLRKMN